MSEAKDVAAHGKENRKLELDHKCESADHRGHVRENEKHINKARVLIWKSFQLTLRESIESHTGFEDAIRSNPIESLLETKKRVLDCEEPSASCVLQL